MQKLLTINGLLHPKFSVSRLYLHQLKGGRGMAGVEDTHTEECLVLAKYVMKGDCLLTKIVCNTSLPTQKHVMCYASAPHFCTPDLTNNAHLKNLMQKPMHGSWFQQQAKVPQIYMDQSHLWLARADLRGELKP
eukprot:12386181-Ditylum_brightwellii.AAC.1